MPLIAHTKLPTFSRLAKEGELILSSKRAHSQSIRELHIGLLNMMPDAAVEPTERQFFRLIGQSNQVAQFFMHPFSLPSIERNQATVEHIKQYYQSFEQIKTHGLDALIISGASPYLAENSQFLYELKTVVNWAKDNLASTLLSCFATHAVMQLYYNEKRIPLTEKCWGVFSHRASQRHHPLVANLNTKFDVPHSRFNQISKTQFEKAGLTILVDSNVGPHLVVSSDLLRQIFLQGHPEYDTISLLKEYKREIKQFMTNNRSDYPPLPKNYLSIQAKAILNEFKQKLLLDEVDLNAFPEKLLTSMLDNTWRDSAVQLMNNWIGCIYQTTHKDLHKQFMDNINADNPLNLSL